MLQHELDSIPTNASEKHFLSVIIVAIAGAKILLIEQKKKIRGDIGEKSVQEKYRARYARLKKITNKFLPENITNRER